MFLKDIIGHIVTQYPCTIICTKYILDKNRNPSSIEKETRFDKKQYDTSDALKSDFGDYKLGVIAIGNKYVTITCEKYSSYNEE